MTRTTRILSHGILSSREPRRGFPFGVMPFSSRFTTRLGVVKSELNFAIKDKDIFLGLVTQRVDFQLWKLTLCVNFSVEYYYPEVNP